MLIKLLAAQETGRLNGIVKYLVEQASARGQQVNNVKGNLRKELSDAAIKAASAGSYKPGRRSGTLGKRISVQAMRRKRSEPARN